MTDQSQGAGGSGAGSSQGSQSGGDLHPAFNPVSKPANPPPEYNRPGIPENPRSRGISPARDFREGQQRQQQAPGASGTGDSEFTHEQVNEALRFKAEQDIRKSGLPATADGYEVKLPADFQAPGGVTFEFDKNSNELKNFARLAHARGLDQQTFSEALGIYAANRIGEQQTLGVARNAEMQKLGSAANNRIAAVEVWLKSQVGSRADLIVSQLKNFPVAGMVEMFEQLARNSSSQGGADYSQSGRQQEDNTGKIPNYENMNFAQKRAAQDAAAARGRGR
jgi:hypothetical protein